MNELRHTFARRGITLLALRNGSSSLVFSPCVCTHCPFCSLFVASYILSHQNCQKKMVLDVVVNSAHIAIEYVLLVLDKYRDLVLLRFPHAQVYLLGT